MTKAEKTVPGKSAVVRIKITDLVYLSGWNLI